jgi:hypothetical protein
MSKLIQLTQGKVAIVNDDDFERLNKFRWYFCKRYAVRDVIVNGKKETIYMHRLVTEAPDDLEVDHINGDGIDNRKENLRLCTHAENSRNRGRAKHNTSGHKGVWFSKQSNRFIAETRLNGKKIHVGSFKTAEEASEAYKAKALEVHGDFANIKNEIVSVNPVRDELKDLVPERNNDAKSNTGYFGVNKSNCANRFYVKITFNGECIKIGSFLSLYKAVEAYNAKASELFGEKAVLNVIKKDEIDIVFENKAKRVYVLDGYIGIKHNKSRKKFIAQFNSKYIGVYSTIEEAIQAYNNKAKEVRGDKAVLNPMPSDNN